MTIREPLGRRGTYLTLAALGVLTLLGGCSLKNPTAPSWEVVLNLPLFDDTYEVVELLDDEDFTLVGSDSLYTVTFSEQLDRVEVGSELTLDGLDQTVATELGTFTVPADAGASTADVDLTELDPDLADLTGTQTVPAFTFGDVPKDLPAFDRFSMVTIASGSIDLTVENNTDVTFDSLEVELLDAGAGDALLQRITMVEAAAPLDSGATLSRSVDLSGLTLTNTLRMRLHGGSPGGTVDLVQAQQLNIVATQSDLEVSSATAQVGELQFDTVETVTLTDAADVSSATLSSGTLTLTFDNPLDLPLELTVTLPQITAGGGAPVSFDLVPGHPGPQTAIHSIDLSGHAIAPLARGSDRVLEAEINVYSPGSNGSQVTLDATDTAEVRAVLSDLVLSEVTGTLDPTTVTIPEDSFTLGEENGNLLEELRKVSLGAVELELTFRHTVDFPAMVQLIFSGEGGVPDPASFALDIPIPAAGPTATPTDPTVTVVTFDEVSHPELLAFLNAVPTTVRYSGTATIGDDTYTGGAATDDYFEVDAAFSVPAVLSIDEAVAIELDVEYDDKGMDSQDLDRIQEASLTYEASSTMNLPVEVRLFVATDAALVYTTPDIELVLRVSGAAQAGQDTVVTLSREQWDVLSGPFYHGVRVTLPRSGTTQLRVTSRDRIFLRAFASVRALVDPGDGEGGGR